MKVNGKKTNKMAKVLKPGQREHNMRVTMSCQKRKERVSTLGQMDQLMKANG